MGQVLFGSRQELDEFDSNFQDDDEVFHVTICELAAKFSIKFGIKNIGS